MIAMHSSSGNNDLPDELILDDPEYALQVFLRMEATSWRWPPDVLLRQDDRLMDQLLKLKSDDARIDRVISEEQRKEAEHPQQDQVDD